MLNVFLVVVLLVLLVSQVIKPRKYPPGPRWYPFIGCANLVKKLTRKHGGQHFAVNQLAKEYKTNVLGLKLAGDRFCIVFTEPLVRKVLTCEDYEGRPDNFFMRLRTMGTRKGITGVDGPLWQEHRQFTMRHLRNVGFGKPIMEEYMIEELHQLIKTCESSGTNVYLNSLLAPHVLNVLWMFTAGKRIDKDDARLPRLLNMLTQRSKAFDMAGGTLNQYPWLRFIAPDYTGYNLLVKLNAQFHDFFMETINDHRKTVSVENEDLIHTFLNEMKEKSTDPRSTFNDDQLIMVCLDLFIAGSQTTSNTLDFAFLSMLTDPETQAKVHIELDKVLGNRTPCLDDRQKLPLTMAVLNEVQRFYNIVPLTGPRRVLRDTEIDGYTIPKNTVVLISLDSIHNDKKIWGDPENFRPSRFLLPDGKLNEPLTDKVVTFGLGRRRCLGEALARGAIFLFFVGVMQRFSITPINGVMPSTKPTVGITLSPPAYHSNLIPRFSSS